ncbi:MAG TPA: phosphatase PAP2 family protein [Puia sp.]|nr:phosphatase PAP2 family protein [Puia sp.]
MSDPQQLSKKAKGISLRFLVISAIFLLALILFGFIADEMVLENENHLDQVVFDQLRQITNPGMTSVMLIITFFGSSYFLLPAYTLLVAFYLFVKKDRKLSWDVAAVGITSAMILFSLKAIFKRHRPLDPLVQHVNGFSFPSGHSFSSFTFFGLLIFIIWNQQMNPVLRWILTALFFLFACAIAFSRVYLHVHFASDVIAGVCLCVVWLGLSFWSLKKIDKSRV